QIILNTIREVRVFLLIAEVLERQYCNRSVDLIRGDPWQQKEPCNGGKNQPTRDEQGHIATSVSPGRRCIRGDLNAIRGNVERPRKHERYRKSHQQTHD